MSPTWSLQAGAASQGDLPQEFLPEHSLGSRASSRCSWWRRLMSRCIPGCGTEARGHGCLMKIKPFNITSPSPSSPQSPESVRGMTGRARPTQEGGGPANLPSPEHQLLRAGSAQAGKGKVIGSSPSAGPKPQHPKPQGSHTALAPAPALPLREHVQGGDRGGTAAPGLDTALLLRDSTAPAQQ